MTIDQKIAMLSQAQPVWAHYGAAGFVPGQSSLCIPDLVLNDAGQGVGDLETDTTAFPAPIAQSSSWDPALQWRFGAALGWQAWHKGINVQLAPGVEIDRVPLNGRNFEYMSEDPYLASQGGVAEVRGIQSNPVIATIKHYVANSQETNRMTVSSDVDQRTLEEIYTAPYEAAVKQGHAGSVMCSYNRINGTYACENRDTLTTILKRQFGFTGFVMSDWGGTHSTVAAANAGLDMEMDVKPGQYFTAPLKTAVQDGQVPMSRLNDMVTRIARTMFSIGIFDHPAAAEPAAAAADVQRPQDIALARSLSEDGTVLLKNQGQLLPLTGNGKRIAVIGPGAGPAGAQQFYNGAGSGHIPEFGAKSDVVTPLQGITQRALSDGDVVTYADGSVPAAAALAAKAADVAIVFAGSEDSEGVDRSTLDLSSGNCSLAGCVPQPVDQDSLISQVAAANPHTVVVLNTGGPVLMPWLNQIQGLFEAWYPGQQDGNAIAALLFGDVDPSAKLPETFPASQGDLPTRTAQQYPGVNDAAGIPHATYSEGTARRLPLVRRQAHHAAVPVRVRADLHHVRDARSASDRGPRTSGARERDVHGRRHRPTPRRRDRAAVRRRSAQRGRAAEAAQGLSEGAAQARRPHHGQAAHRLPVAGALERLRAPLEGRLGLLPGAGRRLVTQPAAVGDDRRRRRALQGREGARDQCDAAPRSTRSLHLS